MSSIQSDKYVYMYITVHNVSLQ